MKKILILGALSLMVFANGKDPLPINDSRSPIVAKEGETVNLPKNKNTKIVDGKEVIIGKVQNSGKHLNPKYESIDDGLKDLSNNKVETKQIVDNLNENVLLKRRESIQKSISERDLSLTDKKLLSGKKEAIKRVSTSFEYYNDSIYEIFSTPDFISIVKFNPDEQVLHVAGGDSENWNIEQTQGGEGNSTYLYIMPVDTDLVTNLSVITTKRAYVFTLYSTNYTYNPLVRFTYPLDKNTMSYNNINVGQVVKPTIINNVVEPTNTNSNTNTGISVNTLNDVDFNYVVSKSDYPFTPIRVYSDLKQTVIEFKSTLVEVPVLFVKGTNGDYEVVNYKHSGTRILVDRKIEKAALRLGNQTVYIEHK